MFCLGDKQGMLINDEHSSWYNRVGYFLMLVWDRRKEILFGNGSVVEVNQTTPHLSARSMAQSAMTTERE